jgi:eukaryotic-like serine/threonine-protein kinase
MAAILATEPRPVRELQPVTPPALEWIVTRCLVKDPDERWQTVRDLRAALQRALQEPSTAAPAAFPRTARLPWAVAVLTIAGALGTAAIAPRFWTAEPIRDGRVFTSLFVPPTSPVGPPALRLAISPDGTRLAYVAPDENGRILLWIRPLDSLVAQPLAGTLNATSPFWSPDGRFVAFIADGLLKRIDAAGGPVFTICPAVAAPFGTWNRDDVIVFTGGDDALARVSAGGGVPVPATRVDRATERIHITPYFLPDGRHFLYAAAAQGSRVKAIKIGSLDSFETRVVLEGATSNAMYADGFLLFLRDTTLVAQPFDAASLTLSGEARPLAEQVQINPTTGTGAFTVSQQGVLAYQASTHGGGTLLVWLNRKGERLGLVGDAGGYMDVRLAPDGRRASIAMAAPERRASDLWLLDTARNRRTRFTFGPDPAAGGVWSADGSRIAYTVLREDGPAIVVKPSSGAGREEVLVSDGVLRYPLSWSPDGKTLLCDEVKGGLTGSLCIVPLDGDRTPRTLLGSPFSEVPAAFSPDGRWVAYVSNESGPKEVYVTSFPDASGKWQVSSAGYGDFPRWRADGKEIFFLASDRLMAAEVGVHGSEFQVGAVTPLFPLRWPIGVRSVYDVTPDGERFLVNLWDATADAAPVTIVVNWPARLRGK